MTHVEIDASDDDSTWPSRDRAFVFSSAISPSNDTYSEAARIASVRSTFPSYKLQPTMTPQTGNCLSCRMCSMLPTPPLAMTGTFPASATARVC